MNPSENRRINNTHKSFQTSPEAQETNYRGARYRPLTRHTIVVATKRGGRSMSLKANVDALKGGKNNIAGI